MKNFLAVLAAVEILIKSLATFCLFYGFYYLHEIYTFLFQGYG
jgi:hypothetical protein